MIILRVLIILFLLIFNYSTAFALPPTMPISELQPGMKGYALTVVDSSNKIKSFDVEILGTLDGGKGSSSYIMARASGPVIDYTGGVLQGMSGSPVYINGKLVGALSAIMKDMRPFVFLITPIDSMLDIWNLQDDFIKPAAPRTKKFLDEKALFFCSGFDSKGAEFLKDALNIKDLAVAASSSEIKSGTALEPGSAFGVSVVAGDFIVGATGTVTALDDKKLLGFGHSFAHLGNVNFFMNEASVVGAIPGLSGGMKMANLGPIIGRINQDRETGVAGIIGSFPSKIPIQVHVNEENYGAIIAYNESLVPKLGAAIAYAALSKKADSLSEITVKLGFDIKTNAVDSGILSRENLFYSPTDVGLLSITELLQALTLVNSSTISEKNISGIDVTITYENGRNTASLVSAKCDKKLVKPGETVNLTVTLQPYRKAEEKMIIPYTVPLTAAAGNFVIDIHGGGLVQVSKVQAAGTVAPSTKSPAQLYSEQISALLRTPKNNEIVIGAAARPAPKTEKELKAEIKRLQKLQRRMEQLGIKPSQISPANRVETNYVIDNVIQCTLNVDKL